MPRRCNDEVGLGAFGYVPVVLEEPELPFPEDDD